MADFDHRQESTPAAQWSRLVEDLPRPAVIGPQDRLLVVAAHPDDETLGAGGLISLAHRVGARIDVLVATDGDASHPDSPTHRPDALAAIRRREVIEAIACLAPSATVHQLGLPDGRVREHRTSLRDAMASLLTEATVLAAPWSHDGHPDHDACGDVARELTQEEPLVGQVRLLEYPIWGWHWGSPGRDGPVQGPGWIAITLGDGDRVAKATAIACHRSQHEPLSAAAGDGPVLPPGVLAHFTGDLEVFLTQPTTDLSRGYFERLYSAEPDPWSIGASFYEERKRDLVLAALPRARFTRAFEPGCAQGALTDRLLRRCDQLVAWDISAQVVESTARRLAGVTGCLVQQGTVPHEWPPGTFDLIVISELGYYLADPSLLAQRIRGSLSSDGALVAVHWRHPAPGYPSTAENVHAALGSGLRSIATHVEQDFLLDVWSIEGQSVAAATGVLSGA